MPLVLTDENCVFLHDSTQWEGLAANACGFVNKSSKLSEEKTNNKRFFFPDGWVTIQWKKRPRFYAAEHSGISFTSVKSQLTIELIDEDYPAEKEEALWRDSLGPSVWVVLYFHNHAFESRITSSLAQSPSKHHPTPTGSAAAWIILSLAPCALNRPHCLTGCCWGKASTPTERDILREMWVTLSINTLPSKCWDLKSHILSHAHTYRHISILCEIPSESTG